MATNRASAAHAAQAGPEKSYFEQQRELLVSEIAQVNSLPRPVSLAQVH
jgi:DASH complex subunit DAD1